jgi:ferredoxin
LSRHRARGRVERVGTASITFFSGTGNTRHACTSLAACLEREGWSVGLREIAPPRSATAAGKVSDASSHANPPDLTVFAFPVFAFGMPHLVRRFVRRLPPVEGISAAVIAVFGDDLSGPPSARRRVSGYEGGALDDAVRLLSRRGYAVLTARGVGFPHSFTQFSSPPDEEACRVILTDSEAAVAAMAADLAAGRHGLRTRGPATLIWSRVVGAMFSLVGRRALGKMYAADERCTSCGWCERACPSRTIVMRGPGGSRRLPRWGWQCEACQRCINGCPEKAIQVSELRIAALTVAAMPWGLLAARSAPWLSFTGGWLLAWLVGTIFLTTSVDVILRLLERVPGARRLVWLGHTRRFRRYRGPDGTVT